VNVPPLVFNTLPLRTPNENAPVALSQNINANDHSPTANADEITTPPLSPISARAAVIELDVSLNVGPDAVK
jgi:hypothetical protein